MNIDELIDFLSTRRSVRRFKPTPIPDGYLEKMVEAARWSPSGANAQPWEFIIVKDPETKNKIAEYYQQIRHGEYVIEQTRTEDLRHHQLRTPPKLMLFKDAPAIIVVCGDRRTFQATVLAGRFLGGEGAMDATYQKNIGNAIYSLHLAAAALGLGAQWLTIGAAWEQLLKPLLNVPLVLTIHTLVPVGYPAYDPPPPYRRSFAEIIHYEKYDQSKFRSDEQVVDFIRELRNRTKTAYGKERP